MSFLTLTETHKEEVHDIDFVLLGARSRRTNLALLESWKAEIRRMSDALCGGFGRTDASGMSRRGQSGSGRTEHHCEVVALRKAAHRCYWIGRWRSHLGCTNLSGADSLEDTSAVQRLPADCVVGGEDDTV